MLQGWRGCSFRPLREWCPRADLLQKEGRLSLHPWKGLAKGTKVSLRCFHIHPTSVTEQPSSTAGNPRPCACHASEELVAAGTAPATSRVLHLQRCFQSLPAPGGTSSACGFGPMDSGLAAAGRENVGAWLTAHRKDLSVRGLISCSNSLMFVGTGGVLSGKCQ